MRVLIVRLGSMGDVLHALPVVAALRAAHPDVEIGWAIERRWTPFLVAEDKKNEDGCCPTLPPGVGEGWGSRSPQQPLVDYIHIVNTLGWRKAPLSDATWEEAFDVFRDMRSLRYDVAIDFQGSLKSAFVAQFSGATSRIGFAQAREKPATMFYTHLVQPTARHIIDQNLSLLSSVFPLCTSVSSVVKSFPVDPCAEAEVSRKLAASDQRPFVILNPGAGWPAKQWPASRYGEVARALRGDGIVSLVNHGPGEEALAHEVDTAGDGAAHLISCSLPELIALTRRASLLIGGDTGPMHLANALGIPVVALFGPTDPARNGPYFPNSITLRHPSSRATTTHSSDPDPGLVQITSEQVVSAARELLQRPPSDQRLATSDELQERHE